MDYRTIFYTGLNPGWAKSRLYPSYSPVLDYWRVERADLLMNNRVINPKLHNTIITKPRFVFSVGGQSACTACNDGFYCPLTVAAIQLPCPIGTYTSQPAEVGL